MDGGNAPPEKGCSKDKVYATLYMKLTACLAVIFRGLLLPGRMGETCLRIRASTLGGDTLPRKNCGFEQIVGNFKANHSKWHLIKDERIVFAVPLGEKVKGSSCWEKAILISVFEEHLGFLCLPSG